MHLLVRKLPAYTISSPVFEGFSAKVFFFEILKFPKVGYLTTGTWLIQQKITVEKEPKSLKFKSLLYKAMTKYPEHKVLNEQWLSRWKLQEMLLERHE